jgi:hypothetical protein
MGFLLAMALALGCHVFGGGSPDQPIAAPQASPSPGPEAAAFRTFQERIAAFSALDAKASAGVPPLKPGSDAAAIAAHESAMAAAVRAARPNARPGDLFASDVAPHIVRIVREEMLKHPIEEKKAVVKENPKAETPAARIILKVNAPYPSDASLSTVPPQILLRLPKLPEDLEYRFVGRHLVLRDVDANMIVDYILDAAPPPRS